MAELKPCPFCGKAVTIFYSSAAQDFYAVHKNELDSQCIVAMPIPISHRRVLYNMEDAYSAWNRRAEPTGQTRGITENRPIGGKVDG